MRYLFLLFILGGLIYGADMTTIPTDIQQKLIVLFKAFYPTMQKAGNWLFWTLAVFETVFVFGFMAMRQELEFGGIMAQLVKIILLWGVFSLLLDNYGFIDAIFSGFSELAFKSTDVSLNDIVDLIVGMWAEIWDKGGLLSGENNLIVLAMIGLAATLAIAILIGQALQYFAFGVLSIYIGIFFMAFGAWSETRSYARNAIIQPIRYGAKYMVTIMLMSVVFTMVNDVMSNFKISNMITLLFVSFILVTISGGVSGFIDGYLGGHGGENNRGMQMIMPAATAAASAAGGAAGGMAGGLAGAMSGGKTAADTVKAARGAEMGVSGGQKAWEVAKGMTMGGFSGAAAGASGKLSDASFGAWAAGQAAGDASSKKLNDAFYTHLEEKSKNSIGGSTTPFNLSDIDTGTGKKA